MKYFLQYTFLILCTFRISAQQNSWIGNTNNWNVASSWSLGVVPQSIHDVTISGSNAIVTIPSGFLAKVKSVSLTSGARLFNNGELNINTQNTNDGINNQSTFTNNGMLIISNTGGAGVLGQGILNFGTIANNGEVLLGPNIRETGIWNRAGGTFNNHGSLNFTGSITVCGIDAIGGVFNNYGLIDNKANTGNAFILVSSDGQFFNHPCAIIQETTGEQIICSHLNNSGIIRLSTSNATTISANTGIIVNPNGSMIGGTNNGHIITNSDHIIWTGCGADPSTATSSNWAAFGAAQLPNGNDQILIPAGPMNLTNFPIHTGAGLILTSASVLTIDAGASFSILDVAGVGLQTGGMVDVNGSLLIEAVSSHSIRVLSTGTFNSGINSNIILENAGSDGIRNEGHTNIRGVLNMPENVDGAGINNLNRFRVFETGEVEIRESGSTGITNSNIFNIDVNAEITIYNSDGGGFVNINGGTINNSGRLLFNNINVGGHIILNNSTFNNSGIIGFAGAGTAPGFKIGADGILNNNGCGIINLSKKIEKTGGTITNNAIINNTFQSNHQINGGFINNSLITDEYETLNLSNITNNDVIILPSETWPGGTIHPFFNGNPPFSSSLQNDVLYSVGTNTIIANFQSTTNTLTDISGFGEGTFSYEGRFQVNNCPLYNYKISITLDEALNPDSDGDGVDDDEDNCPDIANPDQTDTDGDGLGNACDGDDDNDGIPDGNDNCPLIFNPGQNDTDSDGAGNECDDDDDNDGVPDISDNCSLIANPDQADTDGDGLGNLCDDDDDNDGFSDTNDNCPLAYNPGQIDTDGDGIGDACENDTDGDGISDTEDNCIGIANSDQSDIDGDGMGDVCDDDADNDGIKNINDNCPFISNPNQLDFDSDGLGDLCDTDDDNDGVADDSDNCPFTFNPDQADQNGDGIGDACASDQDGDGIKNELDNCPNIYNPDQSDINNDGIGDECDNDDDGDGISDDVDNCPLVYNSEQSDFDGDGLGDACDIDDDNDGIEDVDDNCIFLTNADQSDADGDGLGDACDDDDDNDGILDEEDNCQFTSNPDQLDTDGDGIGDACANDIDGDGIENQSDNCPEIYNPTQLDTDTDGLGDVCDNDDDGDGIQDADDNCPLIFNPDQSDLNNNGIGDVCDGTIHTIHLEDLMKVYPNPARNHLVIDSRQVEVLDFSITDIFGRIVYRRAQSSSGNLFTLDLNEFVSGLYFLKIHTERGTLIHKFIKSK